MNQQEIYKLIEEHYRANFRKIVKSLTMRAGNQHNAEDIVQQSYLRACEYWTSYNVNGSTIDAWLRGIRTNCIRDKINEERHHGGVDEAENITVDPEPQMINKQILDKVKKIIFEQKIVLQNGDSSVLVTDRVRYILNLFFVEQYSLSDIDKVVPENYRYIRHVLYLFKVYLKETIK